MTYSFGVLTDQSHYSRRTSGEQWHIGIGGQSVFPVAAVSRAPGFLDVFLRGPGGGLATKAWDPNSGRWKPGQTTWWSKNDIPALAKGLPPGFSMGQPIVLSPDPNRIDVFMVDLRDGGAWVNTCAIPVAGKPMVWSGWFPVGSDIKVNSLTVILQPPSTYQIFAVKRPSGIIQSTATTLGTGATYPAAWPAVYQATWTNIWNFDVTAASQGTLVLNPPDTWTLLSGSMLDIAGAAASATRVLVFGRAPDLNIHLRYI